MRTWTAESGGDPAEAWDKLSRPGRWHEWAPHVRGAWGLGEVVRAGEAGAARLLGVVPVPVRITAVDAPRSWSWRVGASSRWTTASSPARAAVTVGWTCGRRPRSRRGWRWPTDLVS